MAEVPPGVIELLSSQHGLVTREQAMHLGLSARGIATLVGTGRWQRLAPSVYGVPGHHSSWVRRLWIAKLHAGAQAVVSHESAGRLHRLEQVPAGHVVLSVPLAKRHGCAGSRWHRVDDLTPNHVTHLHGLPVTSLPRTVVDLAAVTHIATLRLLVEQLLVEGRLSIAHLGTTLEEIRRSGKQGVRRLAAVLDDLGDVDHLPRSELERLADQVIELAGLPDPRHEHPLPGLGAQTGFVDRCWPDAGLILEADGRTWHARRQQMRRDADRTLQAQAAGYETVRLLWEHCAHDQRGTAQQLRRIHDTRLALLGRR